jgi:hypothetical protein
MVDMVAVWTRLAERVEREVVSGSIAVRGGRNLGSRAEELGITAESLDCLLRATIEGSVEMRDRDSKGSEGKRNLDGIDDVCRLLGQAGEEPRMEMDEGDKESAQRSALGDNCQ